MRLSTTSIIKLNDQQGQTREPCFLQHSLVTRYGLPVLVQTQAHCARKLIHASDSPYLFVRLWLLLDHAPKGHRDHHQICLHTDTVTKTQYTDFNLTKIDFLQSLVVHAIHADPASRRFYWNGTAILWQQPAFLIFEFVPHSKINSGKEKIHFYHEVHQNAHHSCDLRCKLKRPFFQASHPFHQE